MDLQWNERQAALRAKYASIGSQIDHNELHLGRQTFDQDTWDRLLEAGLWRVIVPSEYGGDGTNWWDFTAALEGLASTVRTPGILLSVIAQAGMVHALNLFGTEAQKKDYLGRILKGKLSATAIADPDTGTDVRSTSSVLTPGPNETFVLNGAKYNIAHAPIANFTLVVCKLDGHARDGISLILLDAGTKGLEVGEYDYKLGNLDLPTGPMKFDNISLHYGDLLGVPGKGLRNLITFVSLGRLYYGLVSAGMVEPMLKAAMDYAGKRQTFGVPVIEHQYIQKKLTDMRIASESAKWTAYGALHQLLSGAPEAGMTCSIAKLVGAEAITNGAIDLLKLYGSKGYHEGEVSTFLRDALAFCSVGGTEEMHRRNIISQMTRLEAMAKKDTAQKEVERTLEPA
ncbi:acyl-CoA dehydrogenase family protein [Pseudovibrio sp. Tun.PSC04-5.I4]|uniref:acyl-CoA dehydrogenase family protein n=1 Tax=Pseudovibrio sp. Tun.PSC04-5.I4 TaxID=1798213 RepID=UPI0008895169|nr:acyl-CoA dehydrogenase family protein [Pseudovibrio sp. Tun.PSC04-5.I4]SDQ33755.1 Acyl-CoA dehydrogenase [Pseudovibrio sp. Tun.PSC04-5.I4]